MKRLILTLGLAGFVIAALAADEKPERKGGSRMPVQVSPCNDVPAHPFDLILGRPTSNSVTVSVLCFQDASGCIEYGTESGKLEAKSADVKFNAGEPVEILINGLKSDARYFYRLKTAATNSAEFSFHTARGAGAAFTFTISADPHLDEHTDCALYQRTLANALADKPDFHIDLGDTFMTEKHPDRAAAAKQYLSQRFYFGALCQSAPLFLVLGNHDGESLRGRGDDPESLAVWANGMRKRHFANPEPNNFYTGNTNRHPQAGLLQDYYSWTWGDALFVTLDPFWFTKKAPRGQGNGWEHTLGSEQYAWLKRTLEGSRAKFKFVFIHHLVGGVDQNRGGSEAAPFLEWGGKNRDGSDGFAEHRPGWAAPIHRLLVSNQVSVVFHGHDHLYAKQDLDGIVYQECPQPGDPRGSTRSAAEYGYTNGIILASSGHIRVTVSTDNAMIEYIHSDGATAHTYKLLPSR